MAEDSWAFEVVHKHALYLNLSFFVCPLHMNIYGPAAKPARQPPFTRLINKAFVELDLGIVHGGDRE